jgi:S1-C subfamily serine protease
MGKIHNFLLVLLLLLNGCSTASYTLKEAHSFAQVWVTYTPATCSRSPCDIPLSGGSGWVAASDEQGSLIITSRHVCLPPIVGSEGLQLSIKVTIEGTTLVDARILSSDTKLDMCSLVVATPKLLALEMSDTAPVRGDRIRTISSPGTILVQGSPIVTGGTYIGSGPMNLFMPDRHIMWFTVPAAPGSSGAAFINSDGEVVTILNWIPPLARGGFSPISMGPDFLSARTFVLKERLKFVARAKITAFQI